MAEPDYDLDPEGDLIIVLDGATLNEALFDETATPPENSEDSNNGEEAPGPADQVQSTSHEEDCEEDQRLIRVRVSSKHLKLASETMKSLVPAVSEWELLEDDPTAFLIVLKIIHGKIRNVPRKLDVATLREVAILVDRYDLSESVSLIKDIWISELEYNDSSFDENTLSLLFIAYVFDWRTGWDKLSQMLKLESDRNLEGGRLAIPKKALDAINESRQNLLEATVTFLDIIMKGLKTENICSFECTSMQLGSLVIGLYRNGISLSDSNTYADRSARSIFDELRALNLPRSCNRRSRSCGRTSKMLAMQLEIWQEQVLPVELEWIDKQFRPGRRCRVLSVKTDQSQQAFEISVELDMARRD